MKKRKIYFALFITAAILTLTYLGGCDKSFTSEPEKSNNQNYATSIIEKNSDKEKERRRLLLEKFKKEIDESFKKVKAKWAILKDSGSQGTVQLAPADQEAMDYANAITPSAYTYVNSAYGLDLNNYFSPGDPNIAIVGLVVSCLETDAQNGIFYELEGEPLYSAQYNEKTKASSLNHPYETRKINSKWLSCAVSALELPFGVIVGVAGSGSTLSMKAILRVVSRLARSALGWIGAAWAILDFSSCMDWI